MAEEHHIIPVWFFVGIILLIYGVLILVTGIAQFQSPPHTVLAELHAPIWWGGILTVIGGLYVYICRPKGRGQPNS
jgi:hypothetical protein